MSLWNDPYLRELFLSDTPLIDVRAPVEFEAGKIPNSVNLPILSDEERHLVGTCYKQQGQEAAIVLGHKLVSGTVKEARIRAWSEFINQHPRAQVFCFRGGLRSQITCSWLTEMGIERTPIPGGQKRLRQFFLSILDESPLPPIFRLGGLTGCGKTKLLQLLPDALDLEELAHHRGSAFGARGPQPAQATFENLVALGILKNPERLIVEDESLNLGRLFVPLRFHRTMVKSPMVILRADVDERVQMIFEDYVLEQESEFFVMAVGRIGKHFGGVRTAALVQEIRDAFASGKELARHAGWIKTLLVEYYDPYYLKTLKRDGDLICFEGHRAEVLDYFKHYRR